MNRSRSSRTLRRSALESLEERIALSADGLTWGNAPYLSISFAADDTQIDGHLNQLFASMSTVSSDQSAWQGAIVDAFQTWAHQTNGDIFATSDNGDPFGVPGRTVGDERFGDIRIGAIPLKDEIFAVGVSRGFVSGTWSGDVLFNSNLFAPTPNQIPNQVDTIAEVFGIALHEAGHVYGFDDSSDTTHVMHSTGIPQATEPSSAELDELWARFGMRSEDINERGAHPNDTEERATHIYSSDSFDGVTALINHGDLGASDLDIFRFDNFEFPDQSLYEGEVTFEVRASGLSQLHPAAIKVVDKDGNIVTNDQNRVVSAEVDGSDGVVSVTIDFDQSHEKRNFVYVDAGGTGMEAIGGYALVTTFDGILETTEAAIDKYTASTYRFLDGDDIQDIFEGNAVNGLTPFFREDFHTNDALASATPLEPVPGFAEGVKYELLGSISDQTDLDYYAFRSADYGAMTTDNVMTFLVEAFESPDFEPSIKVFDENGATVSYKTLLRHGGSQVLQIPYLESDTEFFFRVSSDAASVDETGNYRISMRGGVTEQDLELWKTGSTEAGQRELIYFAARSELTMFALEGLGVAGDKLNVTIETLQGSPVTQFSAPSDSFRSTYSVMLTRGAYRVRVESVSGFEVPFEVLKATLTDPLAVGFIDVTSTPLYHVADFDDVFVFPGAGGVGSPPGAQPLLHGVTGSSSLNYRDADRGDDAMARPTLADRADFLNG